TAIAYDPNGTALWGMTNNVGTNKGEVYIAANCAAVAPGDPTCAFPGSPSFTVPSSTNTLAQGAHPTLVINPRTGHGVFGLRLTNDDIYMEIRGWNSEVYRSIRVAVAQHLVANNYCPGGTNAGCPSGLICKCTGTGTPADCIQAGAGTTCMSKSNKVNVAVK